MTYYTVLNTVDEKEISCNQQLINSTRHLNRILVNYRVTKSFLCTDVNNFKNNHSNYKFINVDTFDETKDCHIFILECKNREQEKAHTIVTIENPTNDYEDAESSPVSKQTSNFNCSYLKIKCYMFRQDNRSLINIAIVIGFIFMFLMVISYPGKIIFVLKDTKTVTWEPWPASMGEVFWSILIYVIILLLCVICGLVGNCYK